MSQPAPGNDRRDDLQADRALFGLTDAEARELAALGSGDEATPDAWDLAAAAFDLSIHATAEQPLPDRLRQRILVASGQVAEGPPDKFESQVTAAQSELASRMAPPASRRRELFAWLATAAAVLIAFVLGVRRGNEGRCTFLKVPVIRVRTSSRRRTRASRRSIQGPSAAP